MSEGKKSLPKPLVDRPMSYKSSSIHTLKVMIKLFNHGLDGVKFTWTDGVHSFGDSADELPNLRAVFLTPYGLVMGDFPDQDPAHLPESDDDPSYLASEDGEIKLQRLFFASLRHLIRDAYEENQDLTVTPGGVIPLENVSIRTDSTVYKFKHFMLFTESIIGFWFASEAESEQIYQEED